MVVYPQHTCLIFLRRNRKISSNSGKYPAKKVPNDNHAYPTIPFQLQVFLDSIIRHDWSGDGASLKGKQPGRVREQANFHFVGTNKTVWPQFGHFDGLYLGQDCCQFHCRCPVCHGHGEAYDHWPWNLLFHPSQQPIFTQVATACVELAHHRMSGSLSVRSQLHNFSLAAPFILLGHCRLGDFVHHPEYVHDEPKDPGISMALHCKMLQVSHAGGVWVCHFNNFEHHVGLLSSSPVGFS